jgi:hypothetical protein
MTQFELVQFIPQSASYEIYYPKNFLLDESDDGIVAITSPVTNSNLTLSGYQVNQTVTEEILFNFFNDIAKGYDQITDACKEFFEEKIYFEANFKKEDIFWTWWVISKSNQIIVASVNSEEKLCEDDYNLYKFMLGKMEIYPSEFEN